jgi:hypothetical protein
MTKNTSPSHVADSPPHSAAAETYFDLHRTRPSPQSKPEDFRTQSILDPMMKSREAQHL